MNFTGYRRGRLLDCEIHSNVRSIRRLPFDWQLSAFSLKGPMLGTGNKAELWAGHQARPQCGDRRHFRLDGIK